MYTDLLIVLALVIFAAVYGSTLFMDWYEERETRHVLCAYEDGYLEGRDQAEKKSQYDSCASD
jgi:hypothetical protein